MITDYNNLYQDAYNIFISWLDEGNDYWQEAKNIRYISTEFDYYNKIWDDILMQLTDKGYDRDDIDENTEAIEIVQLAAKDSLYSIKF